MPSLGPLDRSPHLDALSPSQRRRFIRDWLWNRGGIILAVQAMALSGLAAVVFAVMLVMVLGVWGTNVTNGLLLVVGCSVMALACAWFTIRWELRDHAAKVLSERMGRVCTACGYNLHGTRSGACPECGEPVPQSTPNNDDDM